MADAGKTGGGFGIPIISSIGDLLGGAFGVIKGAQETKMAGLQTQSALAQALVQRDIAAKQLAAAQMSEAEKTKRRNRALIILAIVVILIVLTLIIFKTLKK